MRLGAYHFPCRAALHSWIAQLQQQVVDAQSRLEQQVLVTERQADEHREAMEEIRTNSDQRVAELQQALAAAQEDL